MAKKQRFREVKKGNIAPIEKKEDNSRIRYASSGAKVKAFLTDTFMIILPIMYIVMYFVMDGGKDFASHREEGWLYVFVPIVIIETIFMYISGQTPGYRAYNITLIDINTHKKPSLGMIIFRNTSMILSVLTLSWFLMFFRRDNKNLHDLLSNTAIVYKNVKK